MNKTLNDRLNLMYEKLNNINQEFRDRVAGIKDFTSFTADMATDLVDKRNNVLRLIGKLKNEADNNFFRFLGEKMESQPSSTMYKIIKRLLDLKNSTNDKEKLVIVDDFLCLNRSKEQEAITLLANLKKEEERLKEEQNKKPIDVIVDDIRVDKPKEISIISSELTPEEEVNKKLKDAIALELENISNKTSENNVYAENDIAVPSEYKDEYNALLNVYDMLDMKYNKTSLEKVLNIAYIPSSLKDRFVNLLTNTEFYQNTYDYHHTNRIKTNKALTEELKNLLTKVNHPYIDKNIVKIINLLKNTSRNLVNVWGLGYVAPKKVALCKNLILTIPELVAKLPLSAENKNAINNIITTLKSLEQKSSHKQDTVLVGKDLTFKVLKTDLEVANALLTKLDILASSLKFKNLIKTKENTSIPTKYLKRYETAMEVIAKREQLLAAEKLMLDKYLKRILIKKPLNFSKGKLLPAVYKDMSTKAYLENLFEKDSSIELTDIKEEQRKRTIELLKKASENKKVLTNMEREAVKIYMEEKEKKDAEKSKYQNLLAKLATYKKALSPEADTDTKNIDKTFKKKKTWVVEELLNEITKGKYEELINLLNEIKDLLKEYQPEIKESQPEPVDYTSTTKELPAVIKAEVRDWTYESDPKDIYRDSVKAIGLASKNQLVDNKIVRVLTDVLDKVTNIFAAKKSKEEANIEIKTYNGVEISEYDQILIANILKATELVHRATDKLAKNNDKNAELQILVNELNAQIYTAQMKIVYSIDNNDTKKSEAYRALMYDINSNLNKYFNFGLTTLIGQMQYMTKNLTMLLEDTQKSQRL